MIRGILYVLITAPLWAGVHLWEVEGMKAWSEGKGEAIRIGERGLTLGDNWKKIKPLEEPFILSACRDDKGNLYVGTGNEGKLYRWNGKDWELLGDLEEESIITLTWWKGSLYLATGGESHIYQWDQKTLKKLKNPQGFTHVLVGAEEGLVAATREPAGIYLWQKGEWQRLRKIEAKGVIALAPGKEGKLYFGTQKPALVGMIQMKTKKMQVFWEEEMDEITLLAPTPKGELYYVASEMTEESKNKEKTKAQTCQLGRISPQGIREALKTFSDRFYLALYYHPKDHTLWLGRASDGLVDIFQDGNLFEAADLEDQAIVYVDDGVLLTQEAGALYQKREASEGTYISKVLDAKVPSRFGKVTWIGEGEVYLRSGFQKEPNATWQAWQGPCQTKGCSYPLMGRYAQFKVVLKKGQTLERLTWAYGDINLPPKIKTLEVLDPGVIYLKRSYAPQNVVIEATNPDRYGIFTTLTPPPEEAKNHKGGKKAFKKGYRTLQWEVEDPNGDECAFSLYYQKEGQKAWKKVFTDSRELRFSFDTQTLPDGWYRFKLRVTDEPAHANREALTAEKITPRILVDNHPPEVSIEDKKGRVEIHIQDALSPIIQIEVSVDGEKWKKLLPSDGLLDDLEEKVAYDLTPYGSGKHTLVVRVMDYFYNVTTRDKEVRIP